MGIYISISKSNVPIRHVRFLFFASVVKSGSAVREGVRVFVTVLTHSLISLTRV